jgi:hypothetical protein
VNSAGNLLIFWNLFNILLLGMVVNACNSNPGRFEAGGLQVQGSLAHTVRLYLKKTFF